MRKAQSWRLPARDEFWDCVNAIFCHWGPSGLSEECHAHARVGNRAPPLAEQSLSSNSLLSPERWTMADKPETSMDQAS